MKKFWMAFVFLFLLTIVVGGVAEAAKSTPMIVRADLPADSEYAGGFVAERKNFSASWSDTDWYEPSDIWLKPWVGTAWAKKITLYARPDYRWVWVKASFFLKGRFVLQKKK